MAVCIAVQISSEKMRDSELAQINDGDFQTNIYLIQIKLITCIPELVNYKIFVLLI